MSRHENTKGRFPSEEMIHTKYLFWDYKRSESEEKYRFLAEKGRSLEACLIQVSVRQGLGSLTESYGPEGPHQLLEQQRSDRHQLPFYKWKLGGRPTAQLQPPVSGCTAAQQLTEESVSVKILYYVFATSKKKIHGTCYGLLLNNEKE